MTAILTPVEVERKITEALEALDELTAEFADATRDAAEAEADYRLRLNSTYVRLRDAHAADTGRRMTERETEARATLAAANELTAYKITEARVDALRQALNTHRARLDALRTLNANTRQNAQ